MDFQFTQLMQVAFGYWQAQPLFTLAHFRVFERLAEGNATAEELCEASGMHLLAGRGLLNAGVATGLLTKTGAHYANAEISSRFLVSRSPDSLAHWVRVMGRWSQLWSNMVAVVMTGGADRARVDKLNMDPGYQEDYILGMHEFATRTSDDVVRAVDLNGCKRLIDVGGGAGTYSIALCRKYPDLSAIVLDMKAVLGLTKRVIESHELSSRITTGVVDYFCDEFGEGADAVLLSNVLHQVSPDACGSMLRRARKAVVPGGKVIVHGHFVNEDRVSPVFSTLHNLSAFAIHEGGRSYTSGEMRKFMEDAGLRDISLSTCGRSATSLLIAINGTE